MPIDNDTITTGAILLRNTTDGSSVVVPTSVTTAPTGEAESTYADFVIPPVTQPGDWELIARAYSVRDDAGGTIANETILHTFRIQAVDSPTHNADTQDYYPDIEFYISLTPPAGYTMAGFSGGIFAASGTPVGFVSGLGSFNSIIGSEGGFYFTLQGTYTTGDSWLLNIPITVKAATPSTPITERISVELITELAPQYTQQGGDPLAFEVRFYSPENPADTDALAASLDGAVAFQRQGTTTRTTPTLTGTRKEGNTVVGIYEQARVHENALWDLIAAQGVATDGVWPVAADETLATIESISYITGPETWWSGNPRNPVYPRDNGFTSQQDITGQFLSGNEFTLANYFDTGVDAAVQLFLSETNEEHITGFTLDENQNLCLAFAPEQTGIGFNLKTNHYDQEITIDTELSFSLDEAEGSVFFNVSTTGPNPVELTINGTGLTQGSYSTSVTSTSKTANFDRIAGSATITIKNFTSITIAGNVDTIGATAPKLCYALASGFKYFSLEARGGAVSGPIVADQSEFIIPANSNYYDPTYVLNEGTVASYEISVDGVPSPQNFTTYNDGALSLFYSLAQSLGNGRVRYSTRMQEVGAQISGPHTVSATFTMSDGQMWAHSYTIEPDTIDPPGLYGISTGPAVAGATVSYRVGNAEPGKTLTGITITTPTSNATYPTDSVSATAFSAVLPVPGDYVFSVVYQYSDHPTQTFTATLSVPTPPPVEPANPFVLIGQASVAVGSSVSINWNSGEDSTRVKETSTLTITPGGTSKDLGITNNGGIETYSPRTIGSHTATIEIKYNDWPTAVSNQETFTTTAPPDPQNLSLGVVNGNLRVQWQEPQITDPTVFADSYIVRVDGVTVTTIDPSPTALTGYVSYRYIAVTVPENTADVTITAVWDGVKYESASAPWVAFDERSFGSMTGGGPVDLVVVAEAVGTSAPAIPGVASQAGIAAFRNAIINDPFNSEEEAADAYQQAFNRDTLDAWWTVASETDNDNLRAVAMANAVAFAGDAQGRIGLSELAVNCFLNNYSACILINDQWTLYMSYTDYVRGETADSVVSFDDWVAAQG